MKLRSIVVLVFLMMGVKIESRAQTLNLANARYAAINRELPRATVIPIDLWGFSSEGGTLHAYMKRGQPLKLAATLYGEAGQTQEEYCFWHGQLFFVIRTDLQYEFPIGQKKFPGQIFRLTSRFYFKNGRLVRWIDRRGTDRDLGSDRARIRARENLDMARALLLQVRGVVPNFSKTTAASITLTQNRAAQIDRQLGRTSLSLFPIEGRFAQDKGKGQLRAFFIRGIPVKLLTTYHWEGGRAMEEMYFHNGALFYVKRNDWDLDPTMAQKGEARSSEHFYFFRGHLARWIGNTGTWNNLSTFSALKAENDLLSETRELLTLAKTKK